MGTSLKMLLVWLAFTFFVLEFTAASRPNSTTFTNNEAVNLRNTEIDSNLTHDDSYNTTTYHPNEERNSFNSTTEEMTVHNLARSTFGNEIDDCWRLDPNWHNGRKKLADCVIGFGQAATGGKHGKIYVVTDPSDHDPVNPRPGTLRYAVIQANPLWIIFQRDMVIQLTQELLMNSFKTIDGRGANVHIAHGPCITIQYVSHIIIHGIHIHDCKPGGPAIVRSSPTQAGWRTVSDGDGISIFGASNIWIDHCSLSRATDGLLDAIEGSTAMTISNNLFTHHNKVMLLGHSDSYKKDHVMRVTVVYNHFGEGLIQRMPRCRYGFFHIVNNMYTHWGMYAIGGSANPTIYSQGNQFVASENPNTKEVTKRELATESVWRKWNWKSEGDIFQNGAFFKASGSLSPAHYAKVSSVPTKPAALVESLTASAGALQCRKGRHC